MLKSFTEKFYQALTGKKPGDLVLSTSKRDEILYSGKRVRSKDYVFEFHPRDLGVLLEDVVTTTARWKFLLTGAAVYVERTALLELPKVGIQFESVASLSPFRSEEPEDLNTVLSSLVFARESTILNFTPQSHFEEYKNLYYLLDQRSNIRVNVKASQNTYNPVRFYVILTGLEIFEGGDDE